MNPTPSYYQHTHRTVHFMNIVYNWCMNTIFINLKLGKSLCESTAMFNNEIVNLKFTYLVEIK